MRYRVLGCRVVAYFKGLRVWGVWGSRQVNVGSRVWGSGVRGLGMGGCSEGSAAGFSCALDLRQQVPASAHWRFESCTHDMRAFCRASGATGGVWEGSGVQDFRVLGLYRIVCICSSLQAQCTYTNPCTRQCSTCTGLGRLGRGGGTCMCLLQVYTR